MGRLTSFTYRDHTIEIERDADGFLMVRIAASGSTAIRRRFGLVPGHTVAQARDTATWMLDQEAAAAELPDEG